MLRKKKFDAEDYLKLVEIKAFCQSRGESMERYFPSEYGQLKIYILQLNQYIAWEYRDDFIVLIKNFISYKNQQSCNNFVNEFKRLYQDRHNSLFKTACYGLSSEILNKIKIHPRSRHFLVLLETIDRLIEKHSIKSDKEERLKAEVSQKYELFILQDRIFDVQDRIFDEDEIFEKHTHVQQIRSIFQGILSNKFEMMSLKDIQLMFEHLQDDARTIINIIDWYEESVMLTYSYDLDSQPSPSLITNKIGEDFLPLDKNKTGAMTHNIYKQMISQLGDSNYRSLRLRIAIFLLMLTGMTINELLSLKVIHLYNLLVILRVDLKYFLKFSSDDEFERLAMNKTNVSAIFKNNPLSEKAEKLIEDRREDIALLFGIRKGNFDSYVFTSEFDYNQPLVRETMTREINKVIISTVQNMNPRKRPIKRISSRSFRTGYIFQLWKDIKDIELVKKAMFRDYDRGIFSRSDESL